MFCVDCINVKCTLTINVTCALIINIDCFKIDKSIFLNRNIQFL